jgi:hypothetical protein
MPLRRRRDETAVQARTEEPSSARVRAPARQKAPWFFRRCRPSRGGIKEEPRPARRATRSSRPHHQSNRRPGCPRRHEEGTRDIVQERAARLCSNASALDLPCPRKWNTSCVSRRVQVEARRPPMRQRIAGQRNRHRLVPASSGAKAPLACEDRTLVGCARALFQVAEVGKRRRGPEKRVSRWQRGAWTGARPLESPQGLTGGEKASRTGIAVAKPRSRGTPEPGARESVAGQRFLLDGRHLGSLIRLARSRDRAEGGLGGFHGCAGRASGVPHVGEATGMPEVRITRIATGRERPPR